MPCLKISTNVSRSKITDELIIQLTDFTATLLSKPREYCAVHITPDELMSFGNHLIEGEHLLYFRGKCNLEKIIKV